VSDLPNFTHLAAALVARNDRRAWIRGLRRQLHRAMSTVGLGWSAFVLAAVVLVLLPVNMRAA
jgi:hypothetical protein